MPGWKRFAVDWLEGFTSWVLVPFCLLGRRIDLGVKRFDTAQREPQGLLVVLPGIEGRSFLEQQQVLGLADAGFSGRIMICDWTSGHPSRIIAHLGDQERHTHQAREIARVVRDFHAGQPRAPILLVGYSGGAAVLLLALDELPAGDEAIVDRVVLLAAACSPEFPVGQRLTRTQEGIWHFRSSLDRAILGLVMRLFGTTDGRRRPAAGCVGFCKESVTRPAGGTVPPFQERPFTWRWLAACHYGGHFGYSVRPWVRKYVGAALGLSQE